jgi:ABC-type branched-subunit amino acid transport system substrate-binding protein
MEELKMMLFRARRLGVAAITGAIAVTLAAGCASSGSSDKAGGSGGHYALSAGVLHAFTGQNSFFGLNAEAACKAAAQQINAAGGILGHPLACPVFDTKGDPADAVPVTNRMLVSAPHLTMVLGPDGNDIPSVLPLLEKAKIPEMNTVGDPRYDTQTSSDFWRLTPSDSTQAPALAYYAYHHGYTKVAEVFTSDLSAQTTTAPFKTAYNRLGGTIVKALTITPDQSSYQTEVAAVLAAHPQAIVGEMDPQTASTFLTEMRQQHGSILPVVITQRATQGDWAPAVAPAIGAATLAKDITAIAPALSATGPGYTAYANAMKSTKANPFAAHNSFVAAQFDGILAFALAIDMAKTLNPATWVADIPKVTAAASGATVVRTYAQAAAALKAGHRIQFIGASGPMVFNQYNTADRPYAVWNFTPAISTWTMGSVLPKDAGQ